MSMQDPIADMLTRIRNGQLAQKQHVFIPSSKIKQAIARVLEEEGYISGYEINEDAGKAELTVHLKYHEGKPVIAAISRVSRPSLRVYASSDNLPQVLDGLGIAIISTSRGVMTDRSARAAGIGGEVVCTVE